MKPTADDLEGALRKVYETTFEIEDSLKKLKSILNAKKHYEECAAAKHLNLALLVEIKDLEDFVSYSKFLAAVQLTDCDNAKKEKDHE